VNGKKVISGVQRSAYVSKITSTNLPSLQKQFILLKIIITFLCLWKLVLADCCSECARLCEWRLTSCIVTKLLKLGSRGLSRKVSWCSQFLHKFDDKTRRKSVFVFYIRRFRTRKLIAGDVPCAFLFPFTSAGKKGGCI